MGPRFKMRTIKANKSYVVEELAREASVSPQTVRGWLKSGMASLDGERPTLIMGFQALHYLEARKKNAKHQMALGQFYCFRCKAPKEALGGMADFIPTSHNGGRLKALCADCECACNRNVSTNDLPEVRTVLDIEIRSMSRA